MCTYERWYSPHAFLRQTVTFHYEVARERRKPQRCKDIKILHNAGTSVCCRSDNTGLEPRRWHPARRHRGRVRPLHNRECRRLGHASPPQRKHVRRRCADRRPGAPDPRWVFPPPPPLLHIGRQLMIAATGLSLVGKQRGACSKYRRGLSRIFPDRTKGAFIDRERDGLYDVEWFVPRESLSLSLYSAHILTQPWAAQFRKLERVRYTPSLELPRARASIRMNREYCLA